jgi:hypothetical protein
MIRKNIGMKKVLGGFNPQPEPPGKFVTYMPYSNIQSAGSDLLTPLPKGPQTVLADWFIRWKEDKVIHFLLEG